MTKTETTETTTDEETFPYEPGINAESVDDLDGIDLDAGDGCPHCGGRRDQLVQQPAGWYHCTTCWASWAGDRENASLEEEPCRGPVVNKEEA